MSKSERYGPGWWRCLENGAPNSWPGGAVVSKSERQAVGLAAQWSVPNVPSPSESIKIGQASKQSNKLKRV